MKDLISRSDAIEAVVDMQDGSGDVYKFVGKAIDALNSVKSVDLANSHGKWQYTEHLMRCSECGTIFNKQTEMFDFESFAKYCPYCGAEMRCDG